MSLRIALAIVHHRGRWLVARRHRDAHLGDLWEFPGGKPEGAESVPQAALRELREECGITAHALGELHPVHWRYPEKAITLLPVVCAWRAGRARPLASARCAWLTLAQISNRCMPASNAAILRELRRIRFD